MFFDTRNEVPLGVADVYVLYIGKTKRHLLTRVREHRTTPSAVYTPAIYTKKFHLSLTQCLYKALYGPRATSGPLDVPVWPA